MKFAADGISRVSKHNGAEQMAAFASSSSTLEEMYLLQKLMRELGVQNIDHRLQTNRFRDQLNQTTTPQSSLTYADVEHQNSIILLVAISIEKSLLPEFVYEKHSAMAPKYMLLIRPKACFGLRLQILKISYLSSDDGGLVWLLLADTTAISGVQD